MPREDFGYDQLGKTGDAIWDVTTNAMVTQPASSDTVELFNSLEYPQNLVRTVWRSSGRAKRWKMFILNIRSSADSAASGIEVSESDNNGTNWDTVYVRSYVAASDNRLKVYISLIGAPEIRIRFINSAAVLTTFRWSLLADVRERGF